MLIHYELILPFSFLISSILVLIGNKLLTMYDTELCFLSRIKTADFEKLTI